MNTTPDTMPDGYYWANYKSALRSGENQFTIIQIFNGSVYVIGKEGGRPAYDFTFGPRIEEPKE